MLKLDSNIVCPLAACAQCNRCLRHKNYLQVRDKEASLKVVNTELITPDANGCPYLLVKERQRIAYGFEKLRKSVPWKDLTTLFSRAGFGSRTSFGSRWHGEEKFGLSPKEQSRILNIFKELGVDTSIGFDRYKEEEVLMEPNE